jgi:hypothetical protein
VREALAALGEVSDRVCSKRLKVMILVFCQPCQTRQGWQSRGLAGAAGGNQFRGH